MNIPSLQDIAREAGLLTLPPEGAWVSIKGCPQWPRRKRLIPAHRDIGIQHLDIYWACKEVLTANPIVNRFRRRRLTLREAVLYDLSGGKSYESTVQRAVQELRDYVEGFPSHCPHLQDSLITISHPCPEEVRFYNSEVCVISADLIRGLLAEDLVETIIFGQTVMPVLEDALREIVDALQIDGLSHAEAYHHALAANMIEPEEAIIPTWFYRPVGAFRELFVEE